MRRTEPVFEDSGVVEDVHHLRLMALLCELVREKGNRGAAATLGIDPRTVSSCIECRRWGTVPAASGFSHDVFVGGPGVWNRVLLGLGLPLPGSMFEQKGEEASQPVLGVGGGPGDDPDLPELGDVLLGLPMPVLSARVLHRSLRRAWCARIGLSTPVCLLSGVGGRGAGHHASKGGAR